MFRKKITVFFIIALILIICIGAVSAENETSTDSEKTFTDVQNEIDLAGENSTISLEGTYKSLGNPITITKSLTIDGNNKTTLDANNLSGIMEIQSKEITLKNLKFINSNGNAIYSYSSKITVQNCEFIDNWGGAVVAFGDEIIITDNSFTNNRAGRHGGAINLGTDMQGNIGSGLIKGNTFKSNSADEKGGAIFINSENITITDCIFINNSARDGGGIYSQNYRTSMRNITCRQNSAEHGGAVFVSGRNGKLTGSVFTDNKGVGIYSQGSAIYWSGQDGIIDKCELKDNSAEYDGALFFFGENGQIINCLFDNNDGLWYGSLITGGNNISIDGCTFTNHIKSTNYIDSANTTLKNIQFSNNTGKIGMYLGEGNVTVENSNFTNNIAEETVVNTMGWNFVFRNCNFENNTGDVLHQCSGVIDNCLFADNIAVNHVVAWSPLGFEYEHDPERLVIRNSIFADNRVSDGSALVVGCRNATVLSCRFENNTGTEGGAIYWPEQEGYMENNTFLNNHANIGGAAYLYCIDVRMDKNTFKNNKAKTYTDVYGHFSFKLSKRTWHYGESITLEIFDLMTGKGENGISVLIDVETKKGLKQDDSASKNGIVSFDRLKLDVGKYNVRLTASDRISAETFEKITVIKAPTLVKVVNKKYLKISVKNKATKKAAPGVILKLKIGKTTYKVKTNSKGIAKFNTKSLKAGKHKVKITSGNKNYDVSSKTTIVIKK